MLNKIFNVSNPFWQSMNTIFDLFVLNALWLVTCIPLITIGPATTAVFYALIQRARGEDTTVYKDFVHSFKQNLKQGMKLGIPLTLAGAFLLLDMYLCKASGHGIYSFFLFFFGVIFVFWVFTTLYAFPLLAKFERSNKEILIWAFTMSIKNITMTLTMVFVIAACLFFCRNIPGLIFILFGIAAQFCATILASIFKPYLPKPFYMEDEYDTTDAYGNFGNPNNYGAANSYNDSNSYSDFDEAAFYGYDPAEVEKLLKEDHQE